MATPPRDLRERIALLEREGELRRLVRRWLEEPLSERAVGGYNRRMGTFQVRLEIAGPSRERFEPVEALVDTGSTYTVLPRSLLQELGIPVDRQA